MKSGKNTKLRLTICLLVKHPDIDPERITEALGLQPLTCWKAGEQRVTPKGTVLKDLWKSSAWNYSRHIEYSDDFFGCVLNFIDEIEPNIGILLDVIKSGGSAMLVVHLPGKAHIGSEISPIALSRIAALGLTFGIEVFP